MGAGVVTVRLNALPVFIPFHRGDRTAFCFTVESGGFPFGYDEVRRVLNNAGRRIFLTKTRRWRDKKRAGGPGEVVIIKIYLHFKRNTFL